MPLPETQQQYLPAYNPSFKLGATIPPMATITIQSAGATDAAGNQIINVSFQTYTTTSVDVTTLSTFPGAQTNTITIPTGATGCAIVPPASNTSTLTLVSGGIPISATLPMFLSFSSTTPTSFQIVSGGAVPSPGVYIRFV